MPTAHADSEHPHRDAAAQEAAPGGRPAAARPPASFKAIAAAVGVAVELALAQDAPPALARKLHGKVGQGACGVPLNGAKARSAADRHGGRAAALSPPRRTV